MDTWVKISELNRNVCHQEVEKCFKSYGLTKKITLEKKFGYKFVAFVQFVNHRDAADAVNDLNGKYVFDKTNKIKVEISRSVRPCSKRKRSPELVGSSTSYKRSINCQNDMSKSNGNLKLSKSQKRRCDRKDGRRKKMAKIFDNLSSENLLVEEDLKLEDRHLAEVIERMVAAASSKALTELSQEKSWVCGYSWADKVEAEEEQERLFQVVVQVCNNSAMTSVSLPEFFENRSVFITGATGFLGKILIEKLLRSCPRVRTVYILLRSKRGKNINSRLDDLIDCKLFQRLNHEQPSAIRKLVPISGDICEPDLGLNPTDVKILVDNVTVVFHLAASIKFNEPLVTAVRSNLLPIRYLLELCHKMMSLVSLVHVSTAFSNCNRSEIEEVIYQPSIHPQKLIELLEWMDDDLVEKMTPHVLGDYPNTYTFTKGLGEYLLIEEGHNLPMSIVRPSIVTASWKEPTCGWIDNYNTVTGFVVAVGKGFVRYLHGDPNCTADLMPADVSVNLMLAVARETAVNRSEQVKVYNCTSGNLNKVTWADVEKHCFHPTGKQTMNGTLRYSSATIRNNHYIYSLLYLWDHYVFARPLDVILKLFGKNIELVRMQDKIRKSMNVLKFFSCNQWKFSSDNVCSLWKSLNAKEKQMFNFDVRQINWPDYLENYVYGCKVFLLKEDASTLALAQKRQNSKNVKN
uniref:Fatty acyl-CoA reductase n=1 Tax=Strigamia maritima TaxID=126957 RepID=T1JN37_STRMM